jgi:hypothetical protein
LNNELDANVASNEGNNVININFNCHINNTIVSRTLSEEKDHYDECAFESRKPERLAKRLSSSFASDETNERKFETPCNHFMKTK